VTTANILYYGDCINAPYGNKSKEEIVGCIRHILLHLKVRGVTHFVSACNSMSVHTTHALLEEVGISRERYVDMTDAVSRLSFTPRTRVLIVGTKATIASGVYQTTLIQKGVLFDVFTPGRLAGAIEEGDDFEIGASVREVIAYALTAHVSYIVYACTHYPLVNAVFEEEKVKQGLVCEFVDPAHEVAKLASVWGLEGEGQTECEASKETEVFMVCRNAVVDSALVQEV
jgi:glutamate racemase